MPAMRTAKRREQSRSAAKCRRLTESEVYIELADVLPNVDQQTVYQSDRIGLLRLASMVCRTRRLMSRLFPSTTEKLRTNIPNEYIDEINVAKCLDGFIIIVNKAGQLLYVSSGASASIGFTQIDLAGKYFRDYVHTEDWNNLCQQLRVTANDEKSLSIDQSHLTNSNSNLKVFFRMKTALTPRGGRARKLTMAVYQPMQAHIIDPSENMKGPSFDAKTTSADEDIRILYCSPFTLSPLQKSFSSVSSSNVACTRHEVDMRFRFCSDKLATALQYGNAKKLVGQSFYDLVFPEDLPNLAREFKQMYKNGHTTTSYYRLSTNSGGFIWAMTEGALLVQNIRGVTQKSIICNHLILSSNENWSTLNDKLRKPLNTNLSNELITKIEKSKLAQARTPPQLISTTTVIQHTPKREEKLENPPLLSIPFMDTFNYRNPIFTADPSNDLNLRNLIGIGNDRPDLYPYIPPPLMDKYSLLCMSGAAGKPFEFNSILMAAMGASFPFPNSAMAQPAKLFSTTKSYPFAPMAMFSFDHPTVGSSMITGPTDFSHVFVNSHSAASSATLTNVTASTWTPSFSGRFQPYTTTPPGILTKETSTSPRTDEAGRRHRLDAKTIESFEVAMIKNELAVGD